jgi:hypothetical protein
MGIRGRNPDERDVAAALLWNDIWVTDVMRASNVVEVGGLQIMVSPARSRAMDSIDSEEEHVRGCEF